MRIKAQILINGVAQTIFIDPNKDWVAIQFTQVELQMLSKWKASDVFVAAPIPVLKGQPGVVKQFATEWPNQFYAGSHRPPSGGLLLPDNIVKEQDGN